MTTLLIFLILSVISLNLWNAYNIHKMIKRPLLNNELNDKKYWELKYKMQYMLSVFVVLVSVAGYLGYNSLTSIEDRLSAQLNVATDSLKKQSESLIERYKKLATLSLTTDSTLGIAEKRILGLDKMNTNLNKALIVTSDSLTKIKRNIALINEKNSIQQNVYIIDNVIFGDPSNDGKWPKFYFKDLTTVVGQKLPEFKKPPIITAASMNGSDAAVRNVTFESFEILAMMNTSDTNRYIYTIFITERP